MRPILQIVAELEAAERLVRELRDERASALVAACPYKTGDIVKGGELKVRSVSAAAKGNAVWLRCYYKTAAGKWSQGDKIVEQKIEGN